MAKKIKTLRVVNDSIPFVVMDMADWTVINVLEEIASILPVSPQSV